ncbi:MAG TPA: hypothetical protein VHB77_03230 [Planctomycetaceae bacterium]|nr:hypothetical protein [Planctomycetaceae bacterium]
MADDPVPSAPVPALGEPVSAEITVHSQGRLRIALALAGLWWIALAVLVVTSSNPVVVNYRQIESSDYVVTARVLDRSTGRINIEKDWERRPELRTLQGELMVPNLARLKPETDREYLVPLQKRRGEFAVTEPRGAAPVRLIYPADAKRTAQLENVLREVQRAESPPPP